MLSKKTKSKYYDSLSDILIQFKKITKEPELFLREQPHKSKNIRELLHKMYDVAFCVEKGNTKEVLPELIVDYMDEEQIWQQMEVHNNYIFEVSKNDITNLLKVPVPHLEIKLNDSKDEEMLDDSNNTIIQENVLNSNKNNFKANAEQCSNFRGKNKNTMCKSIVDDKFFKLHEMKEFLVAEDTAELKKKKNRNFVEDEGIDYFADDLDCEGDVSNPKYTDFFESDEEHETIENDNNNANKTVNEYQSEGEACIKDKIEHNNYNTAFSSNEVKNGQTILENKAKKYEPDFEINNHYEEVSKDTETVKPNKSSFELRQENLKIRIHNYEEEALGEKLWIYKGEIQSISRPQNSILEEILEFESTTRPAPIITQETSERLEDIIKQRIKNQTWDDVEFKTRPKQTPQEYRKHLVLDQEKSKQSLAQIYESNYQNEVKKLENNEGMQTEVEESDAHKKIKRLMQELFIKLDALSNFHFIPKPILPEAHVITNISAINSEEVAPVAVSHAKLLAPEEIYRGPKYEFMGKSERTRTDKNRERRKKKHKNQAIIRTIEAKKLRREQLGVAASKKDDNAKIIKAITKQRNVIKITPNNDNFSQKSSKIFFSKLQEHTEKTTKMKKHV